jgi:hypothetical protein
VVNLSAIACHVIDLARRGLASEHPLVQAAAEAVQQSGVELRVTGALRSRKTSL